MNESLRVERRGPVLEVIVDAIQHAAATCGRGSIIALEGYPAATAAGYPAVHDQVFALEDALGPVLGAIVLVADRHTRERRASKEQPFGATLEAAAREQAPVVSEGSCVYASMYVTV